MSLSKLGSRRVVTAAPGASVRDVARCMEEANVGSVVVIRDRTPVGIVTDRDILLRVVNRGTDLKRVRVEEVMSPDVVTVADDAEPIEALTRMAERHIRRLPVLGARGDLVGIVTLDDLVYHVGRTSGAMSDVIALYPAAYQGG